MRWHYVIGFFCSWPAAWANTSPLRVLLDQPVATLSPLQTSDSPSLRILGAVFEGLTRLDAQENAVPAIAADWKANRGRTVWRFRWNPQTKAHDLRAIRPEEMIECLGRYQQRGLFKDKVRLSGSELVFDLNHADPEYPKQVAHFRYFRVGDRLPCQEPNSSDDTLAIPRSAWVGTGKFRFADVGSADTVTLLPALGEGLPVELVSSRDEVTRTLMILEKKVDVALNPFSVSKEWWLSQHPEKGVRVFAVPGTVQSILILNPHDPILRSIEVRKALLLAFRMDEYLKFKAFGYFVGDFPIAAPQIEEANRLLDHAGHPRKANGIRFSIEASITATTIGTENALIYRDWLRAIGVDLRIRTLERAAFAKALRTHHFQWAAHRIFEPSLWSEYLHSRGSKNFALYQNKEVDALLERGEIARARERAQGEYVYVPLWYWNNVAVLGPRFDGLTNSTVLKHISRRGDLTPLLEVLSSHARSQISR